MTLDTIYDVVLNVMSDRIADGKGMQNEITGRQTIYDGNEKDRCGVFEDDAIGTKRTKVKEEKKVV